MNRNDLKLMNMQWNRWGYRSKRWFINVLHRPVTPEVASSSLVAPAMWQNSLEARCHLHFKESGFGALIPWGPF